MRCIACGRTLLLPPAAVVGGYAYGPKCAQRAGLLELARKKSGVLRLARPSTGPRRPNPETLDLFAEVEHV